jgi:hypothetical protein
VIDRAFCTSCGAKLPAGAQFCGSCGRTLGSAEDPAPSEEPPSHPEPPVSPVARESAASPPTATDQQRERGRGRKAVALLAAIVVVAAGLGLVLVRGDKKGHGGEILLEPVAATGLDPFTSDVSTTAAVATSPSTLAESSTSTAAADTTVPAVQAIRGIDGAGTGLYGGTLDQSSCDPERLISFLQANPDKAGAWAGVEGIRPSEIPAYIRGLTPVVLRLDTRVTNHGYHNGRATAHQSVLQAGTAVLVDRFGIPRARCACGNPLLPPLPVPTTPVFIGVPWLDFHPTTIVNIVNVDHTVINNFVLYDTDTLSLIRRARGIAHGNVDDTVVSIRQYCELLPGACEPPGLPPPPRLTTPVTRPGEAAIHTGIVQVSLRWSSTADLDLSVADPSGNTVNYSHRGIASGGQLDVDANANCRTRTSTPVENVIWPASAPDGNYTVTVTYYTNCGNPSPQNFKLAALVNGEEVTLQPASTGVLARPGSFAFMPATGSPSAGFVNASTNSQAAGPGQQVRFTFRKNPVPPANRKPGPPTRVRAVAVGQGAVISWVAPTETGPGLQSYVVKVGGATFQAGPGQTAVTLPPQFEPGRVYPVQVWAVNVNGAGPPATAQFTGGSNAAPPSAGRQPGESMDDYCARREATGTIGFDPICGLMAPTAPHTGG